VEIKGWHVLVEALGPLSRKRKDFKVSIIGDGPMRAELEKRIGELNVGDVIELMGKRDASFLQSFLPEQDCFVLPCVIAKDGNRDGMPLALREGMACGLPALSTKLLGLHETVSPGTGTLVAPDDPVALAQAMSDMIDLSAADYRTIAAAARAKAEAEFSLVHEVSTICSWMTDENRENHEGHEEHEARKRTTNRR
jgi:colanic acid/amylovoran biosynthesis glycosyltransferase